MRLRLALLSCLLAAPSLAQSPAPARPPEKVRASDGGSVFVWRDAEKMAEGMRLIEAGVNRTRPQMVMPLIACMVPSDTPIIITGRPGSGSRDVLVVEGRDAGCRGTVPLGALVIPR